MPILSAAHTPRTEEERDYLELKLAEIECYVARFRNKRLNAKARKLTDSIASFCGVERNF